MALILNLETSTENCSAALSLDGEVISLKEESSEQYIHSESLHPFIQEVMSAAGRKLTDLDAVAVGKGPGSYTGLRIGVSAAKGLAYALNIPLISATGLEMLALKMTQENDVAEGDLLVPMLDARRMEVYTAIFSHRGNPISMVEARVIERGGLDHLAADRVYVFGPGAAKCKEALTREKYVFSGPLYPSAAQLAVLSEERFRKESFEDLAYFEPFYLKEFIAGTPKPLF